MGEHANQVPANQIEAAQVGDDVRRAERLDSAKPELIHLQESPTAPPIKPAAVNRGTEGFGDTEARLAEARARLEESRDNSPYPRPEEFHAIAIKYLDGLGYQIKTKRPYRDFDLDLVAIAPDREKVLIRCRWEAETKRNHLDTLLREMKWIGAERAMMITCGWIGRKTRAWAEDLPLVLFDGEQIGAHELPETRRAPDRSSIDEQAGG